MPYQVTKTFGHELGLSACFRQHKAKSHCRYLHGYALSFKFTFAADTLDDCNWVVDFGSLKPLRQALQNTFDHKLIVAGDDPMLDELCQLGGLGLADVMILPSVGCEKFAEFAFDLAKAAIASYMIEHRVRVISCECAEHGANSAIYFGE